MSGLIAAFTDVVFDSSGKSQHAGIFDSITTKIAGIKSGPGETTAP